MSGAIGVFKGISVRGGYAKGKSFPNTNGQKLTLEGLQVGLDLPIYSVPLTGLQVSLSPTVTFGGSTRKGNDADANLFRILAVGRSRLKGTGLYAIVGYGYGTAKTRGTTSFDTEGGVIQQFGIGKSLDALDWLSQVPNSATKVASGLKPFIELSYITGSKPHRGWSAEFGIRF